MAFSDIKRYITVVWCFLETLFFGGLIYGWGSLVFILKRMDVYRHLCEDNDDVSVFILNGTNSTNGSDIDFKNMTSDMVTRNCEEQDSMLTLSFTVGSFLFCAGCAAMGQINYKFGTRVTRILAFLVFESGAIMIAFVSHSMPHLIFPGLGLIGVGGIPLLVTNTQISNLFQIGSSTIVGLICGAFDGSSGVQLLVKLAYEHGFSLRNSYFIIMGLHCSVLVSTFVFLPKGFIPKPQTIEISAEAFDKEKNIELIESRHAESENTSDLKKAAEDAFIEGEKKLPSLKSCLLSDAYILHVIWVSILQLRFYFYISSLNVWLNTLMKGNSDDVSYYTNVSTYLLIAGVITSPLAGVVYDCCRRISVNSRSDLRRNLMPAVPPLIIGSGLGILLSVLVLIPSTGTLYLLFVTVTIYRSFLYSMAAAFLSTMFPSEYFGLLYGWMVIAAGLFSFFQFLFFKWSEAAGFDQVNIFLLVFMFISLIHPLYQWRKCHKAESSLVTQED